MTPPSKPPSKPTLTLTTSAVTVILRIPTRSWIISIYEWFFTNPAGPQRAVFVRCLTLGSRVDWKAGDITKGYLHPKTFDRAVIVIDSHHSLRYGFTVPFSIGEGDNSTDVGQFHNALTALRAIALRHRRNPMGYAYWALPWCKPCRASILTRPLRYEGGIGPDERGYWRAGWKY